MERKWSEKLKIVHITNDDSIGGASIAAYRLHQSLIMSGESSSFFVKSKYRNESQTIEANLDTNLIQRLRGRLLTKKYKKFNQVNISDNLHLLYSSESKYSHLYKQIKEFDIINFHWISGFVDLKSFFRKLLPNQRIIWTMHDTAPITGACHYFRSCERYKDQCGACYQLNSNQNKDLSHTSWLGKKEAYNLINTKQLYFASPSNWLKQKSQESSLTKKFHVEHIPNGVDPYIFKPVNKKKIKELFNIPLNKKIILFIQKGESFLVECLKKNKSLLSEIVFITIGNPAKQLDQITKTIHLGTIWNEELKSLIFGMCDYFILPSDIDNLPNTILESFASGTPVVASNAGGIPELVENENTGYLFQWGDNESCLRAIKKMNSLNKENVKEMGDRCIESVRNHYTMELQAKKYIELYKKVLSI